ncbi:ribonuclease HII [Jeotgalibacillus proteolyticus]|uniref:ribonuclease HII n=1 Tax=Jeotgalibacillus proteolyticus TaxID=2082395 RepID=UPI003CC88B3B
MPIKEIEQQLKTITSPDDPTIALWRKDARKGVIRLLESFDKKIKKQESLHNKFMKMSLFEKEARDKNITLIAGVDEVGRGPLAGPVVSAAVILPQDFYLPGLDDSKKLSDANKTKLYEEILYNAVSVGIGFSGAEEIDRVNIYQAAKLSMTRAVEDLSVKPEMLLIDAMALELPISQQSIIKGDEKSISIAAASVIAKVTRDRYMKELSIIYPDYKFEKNAGYGTREHLDGLASFGPCKEHRKTFAPVRLSVNE